MAMDETAAAPPSRKRLRSSGDLSIFNEITGDLLDKILSRLPPSSFFRLRSVCKRWRSASSSPTFLSSCSEIPSRDPFFLMVDSGLLHAVVFDAGEFSWKNLAGLSLPPKSLPVASAGGLVCFISPSGDLSVSNPIAGSLRLLSTKPNPPLAIAMKASPLSYQLVLLSGDPSHLSAHVYSSQKPPWKKLSLSRSNLSPVQDEETVYFLTKSGEVVAADIQRSPFKKYSSVITVESGEDLVYFLGSTGAIISCNLTKSTIIELPRILSLQMEYSIDLVECMGEMMAVVLSELFQAASLRVWRFCRRDQTWRQAAAMPPAMCREWLGKKADINCAGFKETIVVCVSSGEVCRCVACHVAAGEWRELPGFSDPATRFMAAFAFEPRVEAAV